MSCRTIIAHGGYETLRPITLAGFCHGCFQTTASDNLIGTGWTSHRRLHGKWVNPSMHDVTILATQSSPSHNPPPATFCECDQPGPRERENEADTAASRSVSSPLEAPCAETPHPPDASHKHSARLPTTMQDVFSLAARGEKVMSLPGTDGARIAPQRLFLACVEIDMHTYTVHATSGSVGQAAHFSILVVPGQQPFVPTFRPGSHPCTWLDDVWYAYAGVAGQLSPIAVRDSCLVWPKSFNVVVLDCMR